MFQKKQKTFSKFTGVTHFSVMLCMCSWKKADEQQFPVPEIALHSWLQKVPAEHVQALRQLGDIAAQMQGVRLQRKAPGPEKVTKK